MRSFRSPKRPQRVVSTAQANGKTNGNGAKVHLYVRESEISADELVQLRETLARIIPARATVFLHLFDSGKGETSLSCPIRYGLPRHPT